MKNQSKERNSSPEAVRKRLENSLPWSLSRWWKDLWKRKKKASQKRWE
jgi:hypothetical protein